MSTKTVVTDIKQVTVRFSGDSGDGCSYRERYSQRFRRIFGNEISTFRFSGRNTRLSSLQGVSVSRCALEKDVYNSR